MVELDEELRSTQSDPNIGATASASTIAELSTNPAGPGPSYTVDEAFESANARTED